MTEPEPTIPMPNRDDREVREVLDRAQFGDGGVLPRLATILDDEPAVWRACSDLAGVPREVDRGHRGHEPPGRRIAAAAAGGDACGTGRGRRVTRGAPARGAGHGMLAGGPPRRACRGGHGEQPHQAGDVRATRLESAERRYMRALGRSSRRGSSCSRRSVPSRRRKRRIIPGGRVAGLSGSPSWLPGRGGAAAGPGSTIQRVIRNFPGEGFPCRGRRSLDLRHIEAAPAFEIVARDSGLVAGP